MFTLDQLVVVFVVVREKYIISAIFEMTEVTIGLPVGTFLRQGFSKKNLFWATSENYFSQLTSLTSF